MPGSETTPSSFDLAAALTVVVTTSPVLSNPSTSLIDAVLESFRFAPGLSQCTKLIVCDGFKIKSDGTSRRESRKSYRQGVIKPEHAPKYEEYKRQLREKAATREDPRYAHASIIDLPRHHGFGFAVLAALRRVKTPLVMIVQHDRMFVREVPLPSVVDTLTSCGDLNMVSFLTRSTAQHVVELTHVKNGTVLPVCLALRVTTVLPSDQPVMCRQTADCSARSIVTDSEWQALQQPRWEGGLRLVPMLQWLDSTHVAKVEFYLRVVFKPGSIKRGSFIEDKVGNMMLDDLRLKGVKAHSDYGTWILDDGSSEPMVKHAHGRAFLTDALRQARIQDSVEANSSKKSGSVEENQENGNDGLRDLSVYEAVSSDESEMGLLW